MTDGKRQRSLEHGHAKAATPDADESLAMTLKRIERRRDDGMDYGFLP